MKKEVIMAKDVEFVVKQIADTVLRNEAYFSELDGVCGDGDFGYSLARGSKKSWLNGIIWITALQGIFLKR